MRNHFIFQCSCPTYVRARSIAPQNTTHDVQDIEFFTGIFVRIERKRGIPICTICAKAPRPNELWQHYQQHHQKLDSLKNKKMTVTKAQVQQAVNDAGLVELTVEQLPPHGSIPIPGLQIHRDTYQCNVNGCGKIGKEPTIRAHFRPTKDAEAQASGDVEGVDLDIHFGKSFRECATRCDSQNVYATTRNRNYFRVEEPVEHVVSDGPLADFIKGILANYQNASAPTHIMGIGDRRDLTAFLAKTSWLEQIENGDIAALRALVAKPKPSDPLFRISNVAKNYSMGVNTKLASGEINNFILCQLRQEYEK